MSSRPPLRAVLATAAAAAVLVGGANLASYAATHHDHGAGAAAKPSSQPKTIKFHLGAPGKMLAGGSIHLFTAKVPKGFYNVGLSGVLLDQTTGGTDSYSCLLGDKKSLVRILNNPSPNPNFSRIYAITGQDQSDGTFAFGIVDNTNPVAKIERSKIIYGCILNGTGPYKVARTPTFTLQPVKVTNKSGKSFPVSRTAVHKMLSGLR